MRQRLCGGRGTNDFVYLTLQPDFGGVYVGGTGGLPSVALVCSNCGNTHLLNLVVLGLGHLFGVPAETATK